MNIILHLEYKGDIKLKSVIPYAMRDMIADKWRLMYAGKKIIIFYDVESKLNYEHNKEKDLSSSNGIR